MYQFYGRKMRLSVFYLIFIYLILIYVSDNFTLNVQNNDTNNNTKNRKKTTNTKMRN